MRLNQLHDNQGARKARKRGFNNIFRKEFVPVNTGRLQKAIDDGKLKATGTVDLAALKAAGMVTRQRDGIKLLAKGDIKSKITIEVAKASSAAIAAVEKAGGKVILPAAVPDDNPSTKKAAKKAAK